MAVMKVFLWCHKALTWVFQWRHAGVPYKERHGKSESKVTRQELQVRREKSRVISQELKHKSVM